MRLGQGVGLVQQLCLVVEFVLHLYTCLGYVGCYSLLSVPVIYRTVTPFAPLFRSCPALSLSDTIPHQLDQVYQTPSPSFHFATPVYVLNNNVCLIIETKGICRPKRTKPHCNGTKILCYALMTSTSQSV